MIAALLTILAIPTILSCILTWRQYRWFRDDMLSSSCQQGIDGDFALLLALPFAIGAVVGAVRRKDRVYRMLTIHCAVMALALTGGAWLVHSASIETPETCL